MPFLVEEVKKELSDCFTLTLVPAPGNQSLSCLPGQFNMLYLHGYGEVPISASGNPAQTEKLVHTIRSVGSITAALQQVKPGDTVGVRGPFGKAWPLKKAWGRKVLIMAGGLGIAPLRGAIYHVLSNQEKYDELSVLYGTRNPETILFGTELQDWAEKATINLTVDVAGPDWHGHVGVVTELLSDSKIDANNTLAFICGPEIMMRFCAYELLAKGMSAANIYVSLERNMKCAIGLCGRCQYGPHFICKDGPVFAFEQVEHLFKIREV